MDYDPLLAKLAVWAETRDLAANRMARALREYTISGITTNISFFVDILADPDFRAGRIHTGFLDTFRRPPAALPEELTTASAIAAALNRNHKPAPTAVAPVSRWRMHEVHPRRRHARVTPHCRQPLDLLAQWPLRPGKCH